mgnify:CR=1 FL=1
MTVEETIRGIQASRRMAEEAGHRTYDTKSQRNEVAVMAAMMNDTSYQVATYGMGGYQGLYCPAASFRRVVSNAISNATGMGRVEADALLAKHEFSQQDAREMVSFSKEFILSYLQTGRKLPLGGRDMSNIALKMKEVPAGFVNYPVKVGQDEAGRPICETKEAYVGSYQTVKVYGPCPVWRKEEVNPQNRKEKE